MARFNYTSALIALIILIKGQTTPTFTLQNLSNTSTITCSNPSIRLLAYNNYPISPLLTYSWVSQNSSSAGGLISITSAGVYTVNAYNSSSLVATQTLSIFSNTNVPSSILNPLSQTITCSPLSVINITASAINPTTNIIHQFSTPYGGTLSVNSFSTEYQPSGTGTFTYILKDNMNGCVDTKTFSVYSTDAFPTCNIMSSQNFSLGCLTKSISVITASNMSTYPVSGGSLSYSLLGSPVTSNVATYSINSTGTWTFVLKDNTSLCETKIPFSITQNTTAPIIFVIVPTQTLSCAIQTLLLRGYSSAVNSSLEWLTPYSPFLSLSNPVTVYSNTYIPTISYIGDHSFIVKDNSNFCSTYSTITMSQDVYRPKLISSNLFDIKCPNPTAQIYPSVTGSISNCVFSWEYPSSAIVSGLQSPTLTTDSPGIYTVAVTNTVNSCKSSAELTVVICVGIENEIINTSFSVYPNPTNDKVKIEFPNVVPQTTKIEVINSHGQRIGMYNPTATKEEIDLSAYPKGIYFFKIQNDFTRKSFKILRE